MRIQAPTNVSLKERRELTMSDFRGVDFSSSPFKVNVNRASFAKNFITDYGTNVKRNGWHQEIQILSDGKPQPINGIFEYYEGEQRIFLVHAGKRFFRVMKDGDGYSVRDITETGTYEPAKIQTNRLKSARSQCFRQKNRAYIIGCGDYLVYGSWDEGKTYELRRVADNEDTYIPTTTISIDCSDVADDVRASLDDVNLLSSYRINRLLGKKTSYGEWTLDAGTIDEESTVTVQIERAVHKNDGTVELESITLSNFGEDKKRLYQEGPAQDGGYRPIVGNIVFQRGIISLSIATEPPIEGMDNIYVTFKHSVEGYSDLISNCNFGTLFGVGGNNDRLFLTGNEEHANIDFHSEMDDYTYFSDLATAVIGSDASPIGGYAQLSDSTLAIFKEDGGNEVSIYYRTGRYDTYTNSDGSIDEMQAVFSSTAGSVGERIVSRHSIASLAGDNLILSKGGVHGIVLSENLATSERYARERSRSINKRLLAHKNLENAVATVFEGRYYLAIDDVCYVADARYRSQRDDDIDGSFNYEWWYLENIPARVWAEADRRLYFGTEDGRICVFDDGYLDETFYETEEGDVGADASSGHFTFREGLEDVISKADAVVLKGRGRYLTLRTRADEEGYLHASEEKIALLREGDMVWFEWIWEEEFDDAEIYPFSYKEYFIGTVDNVQNRFSIVDTDGNKVMATPGTLHDAYVSTDGKSFVIDETGEGFFTLNGIGAGYEIAEIDGAVEPVDPLIMRFIHREPVVAEWYTPVMDFGTSNYSKTLLGISLTSSAGIGGRMSVGYETRLTRGGFDTVGGGDFSLEDLSFEDLSFDANFASTYSRRLNVRNANFVIFKLASKEAEACEINSVSIRYKINKENKGVR